MSGIENITEDDLKDVVEDAITGDSSTFLEEVMVDTVDDGFIIYVDLLQGVNLDKDDFLNVMYANFGSTHQLDLNVLDRYAHHGNYDEIAVHLFAKKS